MLILLFLIALDARVSCDANPCTKITYYFKPKIDI